MVYARGERAAEVFISAWRSRYAANSFATSFVANSLETGRISARGTPRKKVTG
jgi:hypothetical protein